MKDSLENRHAVDRDLIKLYSIHSVSGTDGEKEMCDWICSKLDEMGKEYVRVDNSIYSFSRENTVMLSAHLDQVETNGKAEHFYRTPEGSIIAYNKNWQRTSLGADDKNGVWIILKLLEEGYDFDFIISESEEVGCVGIKKLESIIPMSTVEICIVLDRRGDFDILNKGGCTNYCQALAYNLKNFWKDGFEVTTGSLSDTQTICNYIESVNMSVAYHDPHTNKESTNYDRLVEIKEHLIKVVLGDFIHYPASPKDYENSYTESSWRNNYSKWRY